MRMIHGFAVLVIATTAAVVLKRSRSPRPLPPPPPPASQPVSQPLAQKENPRLLAVLAKINEEAKKLGVNEANLIDIKPKFEWNAARFSEGIFDGETAASLGVPEPMVEDFTAADREEKGPKKFRCKAADGWKYLDSLPGVRGDFSECRIRRVGNKESKGWDVTLLSVNAPLDSWYVLNWSDRFRHWSPISDSDHVSALQKLISRKYSSGELPSPAPSGTGKIELINRYDAYIKSEAAASLLD